MHPQCWWLIGPIVRAEGEQWCDRAPASAVSSTNGTEIKSWQDKPLKDSSTASSAMTSVDLHIRRPVSASEGDDVRELSSIV